ncbi:MAG: nucleotidyltransferase domain-containing protein [Gemmatimonadetes bacterium]|nr:nucleotidyltransferase domain-containing protein [Gemmatimonadota bacterium]
MAKMTLDDLVAQLRSAYGEDLRAVVLYGSAAAGEHIPERSDTNVLVIVDRLDMETLGREAAVARGWADAGNPAPLTLTTEEWRGSADIFPMEYADILERHRVLHGEPPFDGIRVDGEHLRLQLENQALGKLLRLRQGILSAGGDGRRLVELLAASLSTFMVILRGVARLHGEIPPTDYAELTEGVARTAGFDPAPFLRVVRHVRGEAPLNAREAGDVITAYLSQVQRLVAHVNRIGPTRAS